MHDAPHPDSRLVRLDDVKLHPLTVGHVTAVKKERRNVPVRHSLIQRVLSEFDEMPGTSLTLPQATRLFGIEPAVCRRILDDLVSQGLLRRTSDSRFRLTAA